MDTRMAMEYFVLVNKKKNFNFFFLGHWKDHFESIVIVSVRKTDNEARLLTNILFWLFWLIFGWLLKEKSVFDLQVEREMKSQEMKHSKRFFFHFVYECLMQFWLHIQSVYFLGSNVINHDSYPKRIFGTSEIIRFTMFTKYRERTNGKFTRVYVRFYGYKRGLRINRCIRPYIPQHKTTYFRVRYT